MIIKTANGQGLDVSGDITIKHQSREILNEGKAVARGPVFHIALDEPTTPASVAAAILAASGRD